MGKKHQSGGVFPTEPLDLRDSGCLPLRGDYSILASLGNLELQNGLGGNLDLCLFQLEDDVAAENQG